ncbi:hypothetical protein V5799_029483 [Amblyomma americanum]|uniref:Uncharacterized protein n=1 Tax=Amblyomma americanum TaxID=6943 RepID=A0AAQ4EQX0_AMBAM
MVRFTKELASVSPTIVRRVLWAACLRLVLPLVAWMIVYCLFVRQGNTAERTFHLSLATGSLLQLCDRLCDPQRIWGDEVNIEGFTLPSTRAETVWKLEASGGALVEGLSLFSVTYSVRQSERSCHVLRDAVLCVGQSVLCLRSVANTTLVVPHGRTTGANVTQAVRLNLPTAVALFQEEDTLRAHETMLKMSLLA